MVGVTLEADNLGEAFMGDADLTVDLSNATLDLALTGIVGVFTGATGPDITWEDVSTASGAFSAEGLDGKF